MHLVSIVTPFYNTEAYLAECIESVLAQSYDNWEYILLNNCSTDGSLQIAQSYAAREPRIRLICNDRFLGQVQNYNQALRLISPESKYCKIVQADDWIFPDCLEEMVGIIERYPSVGIVCSYWLRGTDLMGGGLPYPSYFMTGAAICNWQLSNHPDKHVIGQPTVHLIRSDLVRSQDPFYDESLLDFEDYDFCFNLLKHSDFGFVHKVLSFQRVDSISISGKIKNFHPHLLSALIILHKYGRSFMSDEEYERRLQVISYRYYSALAKALVHNRNKQEIWAYHMKGLDCIKLPVDKKNLTKCIIKQLLDDIIHPQVLLKLIKEHI